MHCVGEGGVEAEVGSDLVRPCLKTFAGRSAASFVAGLGVDGAKGARQNRRREGGEQCGHSPESPHRIRAHVRLCLRTPRIMAVAKLMDCRGDYMLLSKYTKRSPSLGTARSRHRRRKSEGPGYQKRENKAHPGSSFCPGGQGEPEESVQGADGG